MKKFIAFSVVFALIFGGLYFASVKHRPKPSAPTTAEIWQESGVPIQTAKVTLGSVDETVPVTGDLAALDSAILSSNISGRLAAVRVREGDRVQRGQVVAILDQEMAKNNLESAKAAVQSAQARLSQASTTAKVTKVQLQSAIDQAQANYNATQARLSVAKNPSRTQDRLVVQNNVDSAKANLDNAEANYKRYQELLNRGAISVSSLEQVKTQYLVAQSSYKNALQQLSLVNEGSRPEDIAAAQAQVDAAREQLAQAKANSSQSELREEDVKVAQAALRQAEASVAIAQQQLDYTYIKAPLSGVVASRTAEPGQVVSPGQTLATIVDLGSVYFRADISEKYLTRVSRGQQVRVEVDAYPDESFKGVVAEIYPSGSTSNRNFSARISLTQAGGKLKPAMFARGEILTRRIANVLLVPKEAVNEDEGPQVVYTVGPDSKAAPHTVTVARVDKDLAQIDAGTDLKDGDDIITQGRQNVKAGDKVIMRKLN